MVGLVQNKVVIKTMHEMLKEQTKEGLAASKKVASKFIKKMQDETKERE